MRRPSARKRAPPAPRSAARAPTASSTAELHHLGSRIEIYYAKENLWYGADVLEVKSVRGQYSRLRARYDGWRKASKGFWVTADPAVCCAASAARQATGVYLVIDVSGRVHSCILCSLCTRI